MITQENLKKQYNLIKVSFGIKFASKEEEGAYLKILFKVLVSHNLTDKNITQGTENLIMNKTKEDFAEIFGFGGIPAPADFVKFFGGKIKKELTIEEIAATECEKIMYEARYGFSEHVFENETTKKVLSCFAKGIKTIHYDCFDIYNPSPKDKNWYKKDLIKKWIDMYNAKDVDIIMIDEREKALLPSSLWV